MKKRVTRARKNKKNKKKEFNLWLWAILPVLLGVFIFFNYSSFVVTSDDLENIDSVQINFGVTLPSEINLNVPFTIQAPHQIWTEPYKEFCEEASVLMAASYINGQDIPNPDFADARMKEIQEFEINRFGFYEDTTAEETAIILKEYYGLDSVNVVYNPSAND